jgi:hypothetical protein
MNHILYNISIIAIIMGIILFTYTFAQAQKTCNCKLHKNNIFKSKEITKDRPSQVFNKMFSNPSTWMGYSDIESGNFNLKE